MNTLASGSHMACHGTFQNQTGMGFPEAVVTVIARLSVPGPVGPHE